MRSPTLRRPARAALLAPVALAALAACDLPSEPPILQQTWVVPTDSVTIGVSQILPTGVALDGSGTAFVLTTPTANINTTLGAVCAQPACQSPGTVNAPVPAFTSPGGLLATNIALPATVASATVSGGQLALSVTNNLGFDPLRPNGAGTAPFGSIAITITSGTLTATTTLLGSNTGIPNGATTNLAVPLPTGNYTGAIAVSVVLTVPAGGNAQLAAGNALAIGASLTGLTVSQAAVTVNAEPINTAPSEFDLSGIEFADQVESGGFQLEVVNPFTATAALTMTVAAPAQGGQGAVSVVKPVNVPASVTAHAITVALTQQELRSLLGKQGVTVTVAGTATGTGAGNTVAVSPTQRITVRTSARVVLNVGA